MMFVRSERQAELADASESRRKQVPAASHIGPVKQKQERP